MNRDQMLAELKEVLDESNVHGGWNEYTLLAYLAEGQDKFCEDTGLFIDMTTYTITTSQTDGVYNAAYPIPDRVISVLDIWDGARKLGRHQQYNKTLVEHVGTPTAFNPDTGSDSYSWQADESTGSITFHPRPTSVKTYQLRVWRYAATDLADDGAEPEIPSRFHRACIEWAAYKALLHHDKEVEDPIKARDHLAAYRSYVTDGKKALRRRHSSETFIEPSPTYRV